MNKKLVVIIIMIIMVSLLAGLSGCSGSKVDPAEYLSAPTFSGCDGYGKAYVAFKEEALIIEAIGEEPAPMTDAFWEWVALYDEYSSNITCEYNQEGLSNGDTLVVRITTTGKAAEKIKDAELTYTVEGLAAVEYVDIFKDVDLQFSGISGNADAKLSLNGSGDVLNACNFNIEPRYGLKNGDTVTVTITNSDSILNRFFVIPEAESKTYTVSGLEYYATEDDLPMDVVQQIASQLVSEKQEENDNDPNFTYTDVELYGIFFLTGKEGSRADANQLHFVIHYNMLEDNGDIRYSYYTPFYIKKILAAADGTVVIAREDCSALYFYDTAESYLDKYEGEYDIAKIG